MQGRKPAAAKDDQAKLKKMLDGLIKREDNRFCADCGARGWFDPELNAQV